MLRVTHSRRQARGCTPTEDALGRVQKDLQLMGPGSKLTSQRELLAEADRAHWPELHQELEHLRRTVSDDEQERTSLEQRHEGLLAKLERLRRDAEGAIIREAALVATTLARFRLHRAVFEGPYDVVLVDEVGATTLPEVLLAVARAGSAAVLLGDFLQLGAVRPESFGNRPSQAVEQWLLRDCFGACGITTAEQAIQHPGCAVLRTQYRFGQDVMDLANLGFYDQTLRSGVERLRSPDDPEIVLLDTSWLEDLGRVRRSGKTKGWWPAGSLLAQVLAQHHQDLGATVGIVTPYGLQVEATLEALRDVEGSAGVIADVGTTHRFQGREFDVVVFDMVEDGGPGWISQARLGGNGWVRDGARLFNVGVTRTRHRLYLICSLKAVRRAAKGSALVPVRELIARQQIDVVDAAELLTPVGAEPPTPSSVIAHELAATLPKYVRVVDIHDEHSFFPAMEQYLKRAERSVWIWAPWTTNRLGEILPLLHDAVRRGVSVTAFVRTDRDSLMRLPPSQAWLEQLRAALPRVIQYHKMHQKIMVIDDHLALLGSLNIFSHRDSREVMAVLEGQAFARKLLEKEHAQEFADPPRCDRCGGDTVELYRSESARLGFPWLWRCTEARCGWKGEALSAMKSRRT